MSPIEETSKAEQIRENFYKFLESHIEKFVKLTYEESMGGPAGSAERLAKDRKFAEEAMKGLEAEGEPDLGDDEDREFFEKITQAFKNTAVQSDEECINEALELDKGIIYQYTRTCLSAVWQMAIHALYYDMWEDGLQSIRVQEFLERLDFAEHLGVNISDKYYPEIKTLLAQLVPLFLKDGYMYAFEADNKFFEAVYLESSGQIVLREVSREMFQTWEHS